MLEAGTATEAAAIAAKHGSAIQLPVTDVMLPDRTGGNCREIIRALPKLEQMYISAYRR